MEWNSKFKIRPFRSWPAELCWVQKLHGKVPSLHHYNVMSCFLVNDSTKMFCKAQRCLNLKLTWSTYHSVHLKLTIRHPANISEAKWSSFMLVLISLKASPASPPWVKTRLNLVLVQLRVKHWPPTTPGGPGPWSPWYFGRSPWWHWWPPSCPW